MVTKLLTTAARFLLAFVFIFSGFVKGIDPLGFTYKLTDYFVAFNLSFFEPLALPLSIVLCSVELIVGLFLLFGVKQRTGAWGAFLFMLVFTPLTFFIAIYNPVSDCGCFGDAIKLSNWGTFFKNIPLFLASWLLFTQRRNFSKGLNPILEHSAAVILVVVSLLPSVHGYRHLPMVDFRPFSIGTNIPNAMSTPPNSPADEYETILYYEKDGVIKEFNEHNFPWQDSTWKYVDTKSTVIKEGYKPPITDFTLINNDGIIVTDSIIKYSGYYILAISNRIERVDHDASDYLNSLYFRSQEQGIGFACVTASPHDAIDTYISNTGAAYPFLMADEIMLKTVIRANPGLVLIYNGTIIGKWHFNDFPEPSYFEGNLLEKQLKKYQSKLQNQRTLCFSLCILLLLIAFAMVRKGEKMGKE
jgi:uncharacterized membrane protein YphA (DoxX/SURF4 family)